MTRMRRVLPAFLLVTLVGCGILVGSDDDEPVAAPADAAPFDAASSADATIDVTDAGAEDALDAAREADADADPLPPGTQAQIGVTSASFSASGVLVNNQMLYGRAAANALCQSELGAGYVAYLSEGNGLFLPQVMNLPPSVSWWQNGKLIFADRGEVAGTPRNGITGTGQHFWTGIGLGGYPGQTCASWTKTTGVGVIGTVGAFGATDMAWTDDRSSSEACDTKLPVVCFEVTK